MRPRRSYGQFCPVAQASEVVAERWTPLVLRELLCGSQRFNDLRRGVPLMSSSLLSRRLRELEDAGIVVKRNGEYHLTDAGRELGPVIEMLGRWGKRWLRRQVHRHELDPELLMWDIRRRIRNDRVPDRRVTVRFDLRLPDRRRRLYWLVIHLTNVDVCYKDPGYEVDLEVRTDLETLTAIWVGDATFDHALRTRVMTIEGPRDLCRAFPGWLALSEFAVIPRA